MLNLKSKLFASAVAFTMVLSLVAVPVSAQTTAELTAQINSLLAMIAQLQAQVGGTSGTTTTTTTTFSTDLTVGSKGSEVSSLQAWLVSKGFLTMPAGVAYGYFGNLTKSALASYQASVGITPAVGYFGPITRAKVNSMNTTTTTTTTTTTVAGCVAGAMFSSTTGASCTTTSTGATGITTPGVEGTLSVTSNNSGLASTAYEGDSMVSILGFNVEAKTSDIAIQRIKINLGTNNKIYTKGYSKLYVTEGSNTLASIDLNSSTVVKDGSNYFITVTGFNLIVPRNTKKQVVIKTDVMSSIEAADRTILGAISVALADNGVRGVDGAGIDQYAPATGSSISRSVSFSAELAETASLKISLNNSSVKAQDVVASEGAGDNELDKLSLLTFDMKAEKDAVTVTDLVVRLTYSGSGTATATTVYLFDGSTELDSAAVAATTATAASATFTDLDYVISKDSTKTLTVKADIRTADGTVRTVLVAVSAGADVTAENSQGDSVAETGSATGYAMSARNAGVEISLVSKSITTSGTPQNSSTNDFSTSTLSATFNVKIKAVGNDVVLGAVGSTTKAVFAAVNSFQLFLNGVGSTANLATTTSFTIPSTCTPIAGLDSCTLAEGSEVTIPVTFQVAGRTAASVALTSGLYSVELQRVNWGAAGTAFSDFMNGEADWRTNDISFP